MVLFLDEPTSGLDAASAVEIATLLTSLARHRNLLVVASIHQPSSRVFLNFDRVRVGWRAHCQGHAVIPTRRTLMMLNASPCLPQTAPRERHRAAGPRLRARNSSRSC